MSNKRFSIECDEGECTIWFKKPNETGYAIVMEIGYKEEDSIDEYYFTKDEAVAMAKKICADLERDYKENEEREPKDSLYDNKLVQPK